jgi:3',5'-cyclic AMP phosphodiesterase CpdA
VRTIVHLSDLHFGRVETRLLEPLIKSISEIGPDLIAVSGDLTQRARSHQFLEARAFLDRLPQPQIVVPGNHDIPLHNVYARFVGRLAKYRRYITDDLQPVYSDDEMIVIGVNTARSLTFKGGRINELQVAELREKLCARGDDVIKAVVTHHPFDLPATYHARALVGRARRAMQIFAACGTDILLAGHMHTSHAVETSARYKIGSFSALVVQAGTATSVRARGEVNAFNVLRVEPKLVRIERFGWDGADFTPARAETFERAASGWRRR